MAKTPPAPLRREPLREDIDYTVENGCLVFTAGFLKRRGYCCESGCRNCPYGFNDAAKAKLEKKCE